MPNPTLGATNGVISKGRLFDRKILWLVIAFETLLFYNFYVREISWYPAQKFDQSVYLSRRLY